MLNDDIYGPLIHLLLQNAELAKATGGRIWYGRRPQEDDVPAVRLLTVTVLPADSKDGVSSVDTVTVGMDIYAKDANMTYRIGRMIRDTIDGKVNLEHQGTIFQGIRFLGWEDEPDKADKSDLHILYSHYDIRIVRI